MNCSEESVDLILRSSPHGSTLVLGLDVSLRLEVNSIYLESPVFSSTFVLAICFHQPPLTARMISLTYASVTLDISGFLSRHITAIFRPHGDESVRVYGLKTVTFVHALAQGAVFGVRTWESWWGCDDD